MALDLQDELGLPWDELADGRVHRLVKGRDFMRNADAVEEAAANAARRLRRVVRTFKETRWGIVYFWVQFVDHEVIVGDPCPCGGTLLQVNERFAECASCGATVALLKPKKESADEDDLFAEDEPLLLGLFPNGGAAARTAPRKRASAPAEEQRAEPVRLETYSKVRLFAGGFAGRRERLYGHGDASAGGTHLLVVDFALDDGRRVPETIWSLPAGPFGNLVRLEGLSDREAALELDELTPGEPQKRPPPSRLADFVDLDLTPYGGVKKSGARFRGRGRLPDGQTVLMMVQYLERDGDEPPVPTMDETTPHTIRCVPLAPFSDLVDMKALFGEEQAETPSERPPEPSTMAALRDIVLFEGGKTGANERLYGRAIGRGDQPHLVVVDYPLADGKRIRDAAYPTGWRHTAWALPVAPFGSLIDLDAFDLLEPIDEIADPLRVPPPSKGDTKSDARAPDPPTRLSQLEDVRLASRRAGKRASFLGVARAPDGETLLLTVRLWGPEGDRRQDLRAVPLDPFRDIVDTDALLSKTETATLPETVEPEPADVQAPVEEPRWTELAAFAELRLFYYGRDAEHETFYGYGRTADGRACLVLADYAPGDEPHASRAPRKVRWIPIESFGTLIDLEPLSSLEPAIARDGPGAHAADLSATAGLAEFTDLHLFMSRLGLDGECFYGYGRTGDEETALLSVRDPVGPELERTVCWVPLAPFIRLIDLDLLFSTTPHLAVDTPGAELAERHA